MCIIYLKLTIIIIIMNQPFIYKYQPQYINDFIFDENMKHTLKTLVQMDNCNLLIQGDIGVGKTSLIFSIINDYYSSNNIMIDKKKQHENILIINNLKDQGIQYYRNEVKTFCQSTSSIKKKKKFIVIDDIDFIPDQSQQVFRNCIDKYSNNVFFIMSCNNLQKVIDSIQSRQIIIKMKNHTIDQCREIMNIVIKEEKIQIDLFSKKYILQTSNNSMRILLNYLEKIKLLDCNIDKTMVEKITSNISYDLFNRYTMCVFKKNIKDAINIFNQLYEDGYSVMDIYDNYFQYIKHSELINETMKFIIIELLCEYITIFHNIHEDEIELALFTNKLIQMTEDV